MKVYKVVAYSSLAITLIVTILLVTIPIRFPGYFIIWETILLFFPPLVVLTLFLFLKPVLSLRTFRFLLGVAAVVALAAAILQWITLPIFAIYLLPLLALSVPFQARPAAA